MKPLMSRMAVVGTRRGLRSVRGRFSRMIIQTIATEAAAITTRGGQQKDVNAFGCIFRKRATHPQGFVIGVRKHGHQSRSPHYFCDP